MQTSPVSNEKRKHLVPAVAARGKVIAAHQRRRRARWPIDQERIVGSRDPCQQRGSTARQRRSGRSPFAVQHVNGGFSNWHLAAIVEQLRRHVVAEAEAEYLGLEEVATDEDLRAG